MQADPSAHAHANAAAFTRAPLPTQDVANTAAAHHGHAHHAATGVPAAGMPGRPARPAGTSYVTGAYQLSGDPHIDRMIRLEHALKKFGKAF